MSRQLKTTNTYVLADLMNFFMESLFLSTFLDLVQDVVDFKSFIEGYVNVIGLMEMYIFRFFVDHDEWRVF